MPVKILVCIPTLSGRQPFLATAVRSYERHTYVPWELSLVVDAPSAGVGWNRCAEQGLENHPDVTHLHFSNDDIAVAKLWHAPLVEATRANAVPCMRIEPAQGHCDALVNDSMPPMPRDEYPVPRDKVAGFYAELPEKQPTQDWQDCDHGSFPFCSVEQWEAIGPFPPIHYGTDCYFYHRAKRLGFRPVARQQAVIYNYNALIGRDRGDWTEQDFRDFDGAIARPMYESGELLPTEEAPGRETPEGLEVTRRWRMQHEFYSWRCPDCGGGITKVHMTANGPVGCGKPPGYWDYEPPPGSTEPR